MPRGRPRRTEEQCLYDFHQRVDRLGQNDCWNWTGHTNPGGYGLFCKWRKTLMAHREAYRIFYGFEVPDELNVCHKCDNRKCCNPLHLFIGTDEDNREDCIRKGRQARGEMQHCAKLTSDQVKEIRNLYRSSVNPGHYAKRGSGFGIVYLAKRFGVSKSLISVVVRGESWRHIT